MGRKAIVYVRQSSTTQVEHNRESTARQYQLAERAVAFGWARDQVKVIDEDLGMSGSGMAERAGFARMTAEVGLGHVGLVLGLEVSRLARNNADWYRLLDLCGVTHTLIGDADGIYHPGLFNDRLVLGLKGTMSEAELHVLRARLLGGIRNKAARGELHCGCRWVWCAARPTAKCCCTPMSPYVAAIQAVFERFAEMGSARRVWLWFRSQDLRFPLQSNTLAGYSLGRRRHTPRSIRFSPIRSMPVFTSMAERSRPAIVNDDGRLRKRTKPRPRASGPSLSATTIAAIIDWADLRSQPEAPGAKYPSAPSSEAGGAVREGSALLQGIAICGHCGRRLAVQYSGRCAAPGYHCAGKNIVNGRGEYCLNVGGVQIDAAVADGVPCGTCRRRTCGLAAGH